MTEMKIICEWEMICMSTQFVWCKKNCDMNGMRWICEYVWTRSLCGASKLWYGWNEMRNDVWAHNLCGAKELWYEMNMWMQLYEWALNDYEWEVDNDTHYMWCKQKCYENEHEMTMCEWYVVNGEMNWWIWNDMSLKMVFVMQVWLIWMSEVCWYIYIYIYIYIYQKKCVWWYYCQLWM